jgi:hypothetical protein
MSSDMAKSLEETRQAVHRRQWLEAWAEEIERRRQRLENGEDRELTLEEFFSGDDND